MPVRPSIHRSRLTWRSVAVLTSALAISAIGHAADWPMWRADASRSGRAEAALPRDLHLQWFLELPEPQPAWPSTQDKLQFDRLYEPVVAAKRLFVPSMVRDRLTAYDTESGVELWRRYFDAPVRFAPVASEKLVWVVSDDGCLHCLDARTGETVWRFRAAPSELKVIGNERLISAWPARGGPVLLDGTIYFGAGIWPFQGIFLHALNAETGAIVWSQTGEGSSYQTQQHNSPAFAGVAPQGYLSATKDRLIVAGGRTVPAVYDRHTGEFLHFNVSSRKMGSNGGGGYQVSTAENYYLNRGAAYRLDNGEFLAAVDALVTTPTAVVGRDGDGIRAFSPRFEVVEEVDRKGKKTTRIELRTLWSTPLRSKIERVFLLAGSRLYCRSEGTRIVAVDVGDLFAGAQTTWSVDLPDTPLNMIAADDRLFVTTDKGRVYCFGAESRDIALPAAPLKDDDSKTGTVLVAKESRWSYFDSGPPAADWTRASFDDTSWKAGEGPLGYGNSETSILDYGDDAKKKRPSAAFRHAFEIPESARVRSAKARVRADDGALIYLNDHEVGRLRIPDGASGYAVLASEGPKDEKAYDELDIPADLLRPGRNVLAVSVHQIALTSSDLTFDLELEAEIESRCAPTSPPPPPRLAPEEDTWARRAKSVLAASGPASGYALVLGLGTGRLAEELSARSDLHVIVADPDRERVDAYRRRLDERGVYGERIHAIVADPASLLTSPYFAELVTAESLTDAGASLDLEFVRKLYHYLRPFTGTACLTLDPSEHARFARLVAEAGLDGALVEHTDDVSTLHRTAAPTGSGEWTHQYGNAGNTVSSTDTVVRAPLGLLWFGGPSNEGVLPRHGHGPTPHVVKGRAVIEGRNLLRATDIYTGRLLWERALPDIGKHYDYTSHEPGANLLGSNYVTLADSIYVAYGRRALELDADTGLTRQEIRLPKDGADEHPEWGYIGVSDGVLLGGAQPVLLGSADLTEANFAGYKDDALKKLIEAMKTLVKFKFEPQGSDRDAQRAQRRHAYDNFSKLLLSASFLEHIPERTRYKADSEKEEKELTEYLAVSGHRPTDYRAVVLKRALLHKYFGLPRYDPAPAGKFGSLARSASKRLVGFDRTSGEFLWEREAKNQLRHNAIAAGGGRVYFIDRMSDENIGHYRRRGIDVTENARVFALDLRSGEELWSYEKDVFGTWLGYSEEHDILLQAGSKSRDRASDETGDGLIAFRGATGEVLWGTHDKYEGPIILVGDRAYTQGHSTPGFAFEITSGQRVVRGHPLTGQPRPWHYIRNYGCNTAIGAPNLLTFRSAAAGFFDLLGDGGTGNVGGFRSGCTSNMIPAGGVICVPDYTRSCTCSYQNQASLALVHSPSSDMWTFSAYDLDGADVRQVGLNFGAPGDRRAPDGTFWLDWPSVGGKSPDLPIESSLRDRKTHREHSSVVDGDSPWIFASGVSGAGELAIELRAAYSLRLESRLPGAPALVASNARLPAVTAAAAIDGPSLASLARGHRKGPIEARLETSPALAPTGDLTVSFFARGDADAYLLDARVGSDKKEIGFVIDQRKTRLRYHVAKANGEGPEKILTIESKDDLIHKDRWSHVVVSYDRAEGTARLWVDEKLVGEHKGPKDRPLWWGSDGAATGVPWSLLKDVTSDAVHLDELRVYHAALAPDETLRAPTVADHLVGAWSMDARPESTEPGRYLIRLYFAELENLDPGARVFDVYLQGRKVLESFDIVREAGATHRGVVREIPGVLVVDHLRLRLVPRDGSERPPSISGLEAITEPASF